MSELSKKEEQLILALKTRHGRKKNDYCLCHGIRVCREFYSARPELLKRGLKIRDTIESEAFAGIDFAEVSAEKMRTLTGVNTPQDILMLARRPQSESNMPLSGDPFTLVLDKIADPGNLGTIIRTAKAVGLHQLWMTKGTADPFAEKVIRSALAAQFQLQIIQSGTLIDTITKLAELGRKKFWKTDPHAGRSLYETSNPFHNSAIIIGGEAAGVSECSATEALHLPMPGNSESINAAQATTVFLFDAVRREILK